VWRLLANLFCLAVPFTFAGALIGAYLSDPDLPAGRIYGANMIGSAGGAAAAPLLLAGLGGERIIVLCGALAAVSAVLLARDRGSPRAAQGKASLTPTNRVTVGALSAFALIMGVIGVIAPPDAFDIQPSPYKSISQFRRNPDATLESPRYNAYSRLDIVHSSTIHSAPGLSITYFGAIPPEIGLLIDGDNLMPVIQADSAPEAFARSMPASVVFGLYESPDALILGAGGGLDVWVALQNGAGSVVAVEPNGLIADALRGDLRAWSGLAGDPRVDLAHQQIRVYVEQTDRRFDIVQLALTDTYRPVTSGAFTLTENYALTVEAFDAYLDRLADDGLLIVTRWLQNPPSEDLRALGLIVAALDARGLDPAQHIVAFRSFQNAVFLVKTTPFASEEVDHILREAERLKYDMTLAPDLPPETINRYAKLDTPVYHDTYLALLNAPDRDAFYDAYDFDVRPPTDNHPFFFHFFRWSQTPSILNNLGRTWQPFGGSGYFVLVALLIFAVGAALAFVVAPIALPSRFRRAIRATPLRLSLRIVVYFGSLGLAFLLIEVATIQQYVLILGQPTLAIATALATLLLFSGVGSAISERLPWSRMLIALAALALIWPWLSDLIAAAALELPLAARLVLSVVSLAPLGLLMGVPFARGLTAIRHAPDLIPWAWAINGGASVAAGVLAGLLALSFGFAWALWIGAALYALAWLSRPTRG
jgi:hypothetical protein